MSDIIVWCKANWLVLAGLWKLVNIAIVSVKELISSPKGSGAIKSIKAVIQAVLGLKKK